MSALISPSKKANIVTYRTSTNNGDDNGDNGDSNNNSDRSNEGDGAKKTRIQEEPGTLINHKITTM